MTTKISRSALAGASLLALAGAAGEANAQARALGNWSGAYLGAEIGGQWGTTTFSDPFGPSIFGDDVRTPGFLLGLVGGYNWQAPGSAMVLGIEGTIDALDSNGQNTCFAYSPTYFSANCEVRPRASATLTGRLGLATGPVLLYAKGGLAWIDDDITITTNGVFGVPGGPVKVHATPFGWTVGFGAEYALNNALSVKVEYDYLAFTGVGVSSSLSSNNFDTLNVPRTPADADQNVSQVKLGLNYSLGGQLPAAPLPPFVVPPGAVGWTATIGARYVYDTGSFQKGLYPPSQISQLTYDDIRVHNGEIIARVDTPQGIFAKGAIGWGRTAGGNMTDEDWILSGNIGYSNTNSAKVDGNSIYGHIDLGYNLIDRPDARFGFFAGYSHLREEMNPFGCAQRASTVGGICVPTIPTSVLLITETDTWQSVRVGANAKFALGNRFNLEADAAYLPYVHFNGVDHHWLRDPYPLNFLQTGEGTGTEIEAVLSYDVTNALSLGLGGKYSALWTKDGSYTAPQLGFGPAPAVAHTDNWGAFVQATYKVGGP